MKKIMIVLGVLLLTGCKSKLVCTMESSDDLYDTKQEITFTFEDDKVGDVSISNVMTFEDEEAAKSYSEIFKNLNADYEIELDKNIIELKSKRNNEEYTKTKEELKKDLEKNGYKCK